MERWFHVPQILKILEYILLKFLASNKVKIQLFPFQLALKIHFLLEESLDLTPL